MSHHLLGLTEIADLLGVSRQRVQRLIETYADFPPPEVELTAGRVWSREAIESWLALHPERKKGEAQTGMLFGRLDQRARQVVVLARDEAKAFKHGRVGTEHLLLGLMRDGGTAAGVLSQLGFTLEQLRSQVSELVGTGTTKTVYAPHTDRANRVLKLAVQEGERLGQTTVSPEHILLALVSDGGGPAWQVLESKGTQSQLRTRIQRLLGMRGAPDQEAQMTSAPEPENDLLQANSTDLLKMVAKVSTPRMLTKMLLDLSALADRQQETETQLASVVARLKEFDERLRSVEHASN